MRYASVGLPCDRACAVRGWLPWGQFRLLVRWASNFALAEAAAPSENRLEPRRSRMSTITVGKENSTSIDLYYEDTGRAHR
jgi:hypothetical protein